ncbi:MAG: 5-formyltetrahydrofolate cyclo-ligase [Clostridia bacterium]|nr:5-formyltetrahydrofolate cyclo-ligase [Clostridia bacterium]
MTKSEIRKINLAKRREIKNKEVLNAKILENILSLSFFKEAKTVMTYVSYNDEPDTLALIDVLLKNKKRVCSPVCFENSEMKAFAFNNISELKTSKMGILEPNQDVFISPEEIDLVIVPMCAFNERGHRIGYGKGFYDRYLPKTKAIKCGICFEELKSDFNEDKLDSPLDYVITEKNIYCFNKK